MLIMALLADFTGHQLMNEKDQKLFILKMIEEKQHSTHHTVWKDYEFTLLKKDILDTSGVTINTHTLKRLFGKINYKKDYRPLAGQRRICRGGSFSSVSWISRNTARGTYRPNSRCPDSGFRIVM